MIYFVVKINIFFKFFIHKFAREFNVFLIIIVILINNVLICKTTFQNQNNRFFLFENFFKRTH